MPAAMACSSVILSEFSSMDLRLPGEDERGGQRKEPETAELCRLDPTESLDMRR